MRPDTPNEHAHVNIPGVDLYRAGKPLDRGLIVAQVQVRNPCDRVPQPHLRVARAEPYGSLGARRRPAQPRPAGASAAPSRQGDFGPDEDRMMRAAVPAAPAG
jgi:hypothetical protein